tara:strand:- start:4986 stop:5246 length:261 start_codon:yes stop_codon:yes gene_type:complete
MEQTPNCEAPPPHGSTATTKCEVDVRVLWSSGLTGTSPGGRARKSMTSVVGKARLLESAAMPIDSRRSIACEHGRRYLKRKAAVVG